MNNEPLKERKIGPALEGKAAEAFGGPAARPPQMGGMAPAPAVAAVAPLGNPLFDATPPETVAKRKQVELVRLRLGALVRQIQTESAELTDVIAGLAGDPVAIAEGFVASTATKFLTDLGKVVTALSAKPEKPEAPKA